jgi:SOS-response transcriptional repressor LexA
MGKNAGGEHLFAPRVQSDSMEPEFREGAIVIVKCLGHGSEDATLKQFKKMGDIYFLHPLSPAYEDVPLTRKYTIAGKVVRHQKDY